MADELDRKIIEDYEASLKRLQKLNEKTLKIQDRDFDARVKAVRERFNERRQEIRDQHKSGLVRKELIKLLEREEDQFEKNLKHREKLRKATENVSSALGGLYGAAERGEGAISSFTDVFKGRGVLGDAFSSLGNRLDINIETFRQLSQTGANFGQSIVQMREAAGQALLPLDDFAQLVGENAQNLAALYGSTTAGARGLANLSEGLRTASVESLAPLGFTVDEINSTLLLNLERQRRTFNFDANARAQNIQSAFNFAKQLDRLAKLTGTQREELQRQIEAQMSNERFQAMLGQQTDSTRQRLENFAATIGTLSPELAEGFQDLIANSGRPVTEAAISLVQNMPEAQAAIQNLISGTTSTEQALMSVRNASIRSYQRFDKATVTGTVDFLRLQGGVIKLATTNMDLNAVLEEQGATATSLTQGLTEFQDAAKRLSGQFQKIETGLLSAFGPALGGLAKMTEGGMKVFGSFAAVIAQIPALTATALGGILLGKYLFSRGEQVMITAAGVRLGTAGLGKLLTSIGIGGKGSAIGRIGGSVGRVLPGLGAAVGVGSSLAMLGSEDEDTRKKGKWGLGGAAAGALLGQFLIPIPGVGALIGAGLGSMAGQFAGGRQFGGPMDSGKSYLVHKDEIITSGTSSTAVAKSDVSDILNTKYESMEKHLAAISTNITAGNKIRTSALESLNTSNMINNKTRVAVERTARTDPNRVGLV